MPANGNAAGGGMRAEGGRTGGVGSAGRSLATAVEQAGARVRQIAAERVTSALRQPNVRTLRYAVLLLPLAQVGLMLYVILFRTSGTVFWDEWWNVPVVEHANAGTLSVYDFWQLHNESHRIVIPRLIDIGVIQMTHWNEQALMLVNVAAGVATAVLLFFVMRRTLGSLNRALALAVPASLLLFSLAYWGDWFIAFQITYFMTVLGIAITLWAFDVHPLSSRWFWLGVAGALVATLSSFAGLAAWIVFLPRVYQAGRRRFIAWVGIGGVVTAAYMYQYPHPTAHHSLGYIVEMLLFFVAYLGGPLGYPIAWISLALGFVSCLFVAGNLAFAWRLRVPLEKLWVWVELALFALATDAFTSLGRAFGGASDAVQTRYTIFPALWWLAAVMIAALVVQEALRQGRAGANETDEKRWLVRLLVPAMLANGLVVLLICVASIMTSIAGLHDTFVFENGLLVNQGCMMHPETSSNACLEHFLPVEWKGMILPEITYLQQHHYAIYSTAAAPQPGAHK